MYNYNGTQDSLFAPTKLAIHFLLRPVVDLVLNCGHHSKSRFFNDIVHFIDEENIVTGVDFDGDKFFHTEAPTIVGRINRKCENILRSCERIEWIPTNDQHKCSIDEEHASNIFLNPCSLCNMHPTALSSFNYITDRDFLSKW